MIRFEKKILDNGLKVIIAPMENTEAATLLALVGVGSRYETEKINGVSHFLEHLFFKGSKKRPKPGQIHADLDRIGASHNAFTSKETTGFWVKSSVKDFDTGLDIVADILLQPLFKEEEIEKERGVILQEISMYEDEPRRKVWENLERIMFGNQPLGWDIAGTKETITGIKKEDITKYRAANYLSKDIIVIAAGNLESRKTFVKIKKYFEKTAQGKNKPGGKVKIFQKSPRIEVLGKDVDQTHLALASRAYDMHDEKRYALNLLSTVLGGNTSSRLFMEIREKLGLAYYVFASPDYYSDAGYLGIGAGVGHSEAERIVKKITEILKDFKTKAPIKKDLDAAKSYVRGQMALSLETSDEIASFCATQELFYKKIVQPEDMLKKIEKVRESDILRVAKEIFKPERLNLAVIGAKENIVKKETAYKQSLSWISP